MLILLVIIFSMLIINYVINRYLMNRLHIEGSPNKYVNRIHKYIENPLYVITFIVITISIHDFHFLRIFIFVIPALMFAFRAIMQVMYEKERKTYIHSVVALGLFIIGGIIYMILEMNTSIT